MYRKKILLGGVAAILSASLLAACGAPEPISFTGYAMGTVVSETLYTKGDDVSTDIETAIKTLENDHLSNKVSRAEIYKINEKAGQGSVVMSDELHEYMNTLLDVSAKSAGAFDPTVGALSKLWDFDDDAHKVPVDDRIQSCLSKGNYTNIQIDGNSISLPEGLQLDLGAAGKGIALDTARGILEKADGLEGAVISVGESSILTYGSKPDGGKWEIGIRDPRDKEQLTGSVMLDGTNCVGTSGDYQKYFIKDGTRYHHILDPKTGYPARSDVMSVTIVCDSGIMCDALTTACFVLGTEKGKALAEEYGAAAIFINADREVIMTDNAKKIWKDAE